MVLKRFGQLFLTLKKTSENKHFELKRNDQQKYWMNESLKERVLNDFYSNEIYTKNKTKIESRLDNGEITSFQAAELLYNITHQK